MKTWTKETALHELNGLISIIDQLAKQPRYSADHIRWAGNTLQFLEEVFGGNSRYYLTFSTFEWRRKGSFVVRGPDPDIGAEEKHQEAYIKELGSAKGLLQSAYDYLSRSDLASVYDGKDTPRESSAILRIFNIAERKLRKTIRDIPSHEREIQDAFENLLIGADIPYSRDTESIEYSSKTYTPDFCIKRIDLTIEIKLCGRKGREKEIIAEINDDILAYQTKYGNILFVVYDVGFIRDIDRFKGEFEKNENVTVLVVKH